MDFFTHYRKIKDRKQKRNLRKKIIESCMIEPSTFYSWIYRKSVTPLSRVKIAEIMQKKVSELFPEVETSSN